jgi:hypothetical protein
VQSTRGSATYGVTSRKVTDEVNDIAHAQHFRSFRGHHIISGKTYAKL